MTDVDAPLVPFKRGKGPLVSVLLPTRGRVSGLLAALDSLHSLSRYKNIEYLLKIDEDDKETLDAYEGLKKIIAVRALISPQGNGYRDFHLWINELCSMSKGDWLYMFNDDALMQCQDWDVVLATMGFSPGATWHGVSDVCMFITPTVQRPESYEMAFVRRKVFEILGHYSLNPHCDNWMASVMCFLSSAFRIDPVQVSHPEHGDRQKLVETYKETGDALNTPVQQRQRIKDIEKLIAYIEEHKK